MTEQERNELMQIVRELSYEEREVTLASGRKSNFYFDGKQTALHAQGEDAEAATDEDPKPVAAEAETSKPRPAAGVATPDAAPPAAELKLIGMRVEPALDELDLYLDRALLAGLEQVRVVHGHGSGRLREAVREHLRHHPAVASHRAGRKSEGGNGATVVTLAG